VRLVGTARGPGGSDRVEASLPVLARGVKRVEGRSGTISTSGADLQETFLDVPEGAVPGATRLTVLLNPGVGSAVLDALAHLDLYPWGCVEQTVHRFLPAVWARAAFAASGSPDAKRLADLDEAVRRGVARLRNLANADGSYGWFPGGSGDVAMTAYALLGLRGAQRAGHAGLEAPIAKAAEALRGLARASEGDRQALAHWALATAGGLDAESYGIAFRRREELSPTGLAWMTLAALEADRRYDADEAARLLLSRAVDEPEGTRWPARPEDCFTGSDREATGFAVASLLRARVVTPRAERGLRWLLATRPPGERATTKDEAAFVAAASAWIESARPSGFGGRIDVLLDGVVVRTLTVEPGAGLAPRDRRVALDASSLRPGRHALGFRLHGEGEAHFAARLEAVVPQGLDEPEPHGVSVARLYLDAEVLPVEGKDGALTAEMPPKPGYEVLRPAARPRVPAKSRERAASGERLLVRLTLEAPRDLEYVLVEDPLPAGFEVLDETAAGPFDWQERRDDRQVFFLSRVKAGPVVLTYALQAVHPGAYTALPTTAYAMYAPEVFGRGTANLVSVGPGGRPHDPEAGPTPDELWARARALLEAKRWDEADAALRALRDGQPALRDEVLEELEAGLLRAALERKDARGIVAAREALVRRAPARIPSTIEAALAIAGAYADVSDHRTAATLFRELSVRVFGLEAGFADALAARGREAEGLFGLERALAGHAVANATASAALRRAMRLREVARPVGAPGRTGAPMHEEAAEALRRASAHYAETGAAAAASYALVEALRTVRALDEAEVEATAYPRRFPESPYVDDVLGFLVDVRMRRFEASPSPDTAAPVLEAARRLASERFHRPDGSLGPSDLAPRAHHAIARVLHATGDLRGAVEAYRKAASIEDAREALAWLVEPRLETPEVVTAGVGGEARLPIRSRNASTARLRAYPVDLQVLFAVRKSLEGLNRIDLAGIVPAKEWTVPLDARPHVWAETEVALPVGADAPGAFLVLAKAGDLESATMVLKTDLRAVLQRAGEKVRVHVTDAAGTPVRDAYVTVSDGSAVKARGRTDARGVFEAPSAGASPAAVVNVGDRYALAR
jgi:tetratricopeptide (TPR) repeat protein